MCVHVFLVMLAFVEHK